MNFSLRNIFLSKKTTATASEASKTDERKRATKVIKKQAKREVPYEIKDIKLAIDMAKNVDYPDRSKLLKIFNYILRDGHLMSQIKTALIKVQSEPWMIYHNGKPDEAVSEMFRRKWFNTIIAHIFYKEMFGFTLLECDGVDASTNTIGSITSIDREYVSIERQWILLEGNINGSYLPYGDIMQELDLLQFGDSENLGCLLECAYNVIWKYYARSDWSRANEKVGTPILSVVADTNNEDELDAIEAKAANFGTDGYIIGQKGDEHELLERKSDNFHLTFKDKIALCNDELSKIINGQSVTADTTAFVGSAQVGERTMDDFTQARLQGIVDEMKETVWPYLLYKTFKVDGYEFDYPRLKRERDNKINGIATVTDPANKPDEPAPPTPPKPNPKKKR